MSPVNHYGLYQGSGSLIAVDYCERKRHLRLLFFKILFVLISPCGFAVAVEAQIRRQQKEERDRWWVTKVGGGWVVAPTSWCLGLQGRWCRICKLSQQATRSTSYRVESVPSAQPKLTSAGHTSPTDPFLPPPTTQIWSRSTRI